MQQCLLSPRFGVHHPLNGTTMFSAHAPVHEGFEALCIGEIELWAWQASDSMQSKSHDAVQMLGST